MQVELFQLYLLFLVSIYSLFYLQIVEAKIPFSLTLQPLFKPF